MERRKAKTGARRATPDATVLPVIEEEARTGKREVEVGRVRLVRRTRRRIQDVDVPLESTRASVRRVPIEAPAPAGPPPQNRWEGDTLIVPVLEERVVVQRQLWIREELHVTLEHRTTRHRESVELRADEIDVERMSPERAPPARRDA